MMQSETIGKLIAAIGAAMADIGYVRGTGENSHQRYKYTSDEDLTAAVQPVMAKHGLAMLPSGCEVERVEVKTAKGGSASSVHVVQTWTVAHSSGEWMRIQMPGEGRDSQDKGTPKALTAARKYALRHLFCVPTGDDAEKEAKVNGEPDHSPYVSELLDRIAGLQAAGIKGANAAASTLLEKARGRWSDEQIKKAHPKMEGWIVAEEAKLAAAKGGE